MCGYNKDGGSYCNQGLGDSLVTDFYAKLSTVLKAGVNCHDHSDSIWWGADCADLITKLGPTYESFMWKYYYLNATSGFLNTPYVANNTNCVSTQITELYWQGAGPLPSMSSTIKGSLIGSLLIAASLL